MSCHVELDFNDDGTVTMTGRPKKGAEITTTVLGSADQTITVSILAGDDNTKTHALMIGTKAAIDHARMMQTYGWAA